jgi:hypothetical protein
MSCRRYRKMLALNRPGELSGREAEGLAQHLRTCTECSEEFKRVQAADRIVERLRSTPPILEHPAALVDAVLTGISRPGAATARRSRREVSSRLLDFVLSPAIRFGTAGLAVIAIGVFVVQEAFLLSSVNALEEKMAAQTPPRRGPEIGYSISSAMARRNADLHQLQKQVMPEWEVKVNGSLVVSRRTLDQFVDGMGPGPLETLRLASILGSDPRRIGSLVRYLEQHATVKVFF